MSFSKLFALRFRDMLRRREFFVALLTALILFLLPAFADILRLFGHDLSGIRPPWYYFGFSIIRVQNSISSVVFQAVCLSVIPLFASAAYSYCCFDESRYGIKNVMLAKTGRSAYYLSCALAVFAAGFFIIFIPMLLNLLVFLAAVPFSAYAPTETCTPDKTFSSFSNITYFRSLAINHHYLFALLYCFIPAVISALLGLLSFSFSLFFKKNKFLVVAFPLLIYLAGGLILSTCGFTNWVLQYMTMPPFFWSDSYHLLLSHLLIMIAALLIINIGALIVKIRFKKDEI